MFITKKTSLIRLNAAAGLLLGLSLMGCAQPMPKAAASNDEARYATVLIYRTAGGAGAPQVLVNSKLAGRLGESGYLQHQSPVGPVALEVGSVQGTQNALSGTSRAVTLVAGQVSYWRMDIRPVSAAGELPQAVLVEVPAAQARQEIRQITR